MENVDYIIVGDGYASLFFAHQLYQNKKSFRVFSEGRKSASHVSAGMVNPAVLKKFTTFWKAQEQIDFLKFTLAEIENYTYRNYLINEQVHRIFHDENERELWLKKSDNEDLRNFLSKEFVAIDGIRNPYKTGKVLQSARLDVESFFSDLLQFFTLNGNLIAERFDYQQLQKNTYKNFTFKKIIFCEGMGVVENPFFSFVSVEPNKGHHLEVKLSMPIDSNFTLKKKHFLFPLKNGNYYYGGTYDRDQLYSKIDESAKQQLINGLAEFYPDDFEVINVEFGFRPTVKDRRPIIGQHLEFSDYYVFNGLGARGVLNGCYFAKQLYDHLEKGEKLDEEVDLKRFL